MHQLAPLFLQAAVLGLSRSQIRVAVDVLIRNFCARTQPLCLFRERDLLLLQVAHGPCQGGLIDSRSYLPNLLFDLRHLYRHKLVDSGKPFLVQVVQLITISRTRNIPASANSCGERPRCVDDELPLRALSLESSLFLPQPLFFIFIFFFIISFFPTSTFRFTLILTVNLSGFPFLP